jgi:hypothetical protein
VKHFCHDSNMHVTMYFTVIRYTIAVLNQHVEPGFPYVSDTGSYSPESCIFGQFLNIAAFISEYYREFAHQMQVVLHEKSLSTHDCYCKKCSETVTTRMKMHS